MYSQVGKSKEKKNQAATPVSQQQGNGGTRFQFVDNRPVAVQMQKLHEMAYNSLQVKQLRALTKMVNNHPQNKQTAQLQAMADNYVARQKQPIQASGVMLDASNIDGFLSTLRLRVDTEANKILAQINQTTDHCPYIAKWFQYYSNKEPAHIKNAVERFAPQSKKALTMRDYIEFIVDRVKKGLIDHVKTGTTKDIPDEILDEQHKPEDFLHIAERNEPSIQRSCLIDFFKGDTHERLDDQENDIEIPIRTVRRPKVHGLRQGDGIVAMPGDIVVNLATTTCGLVIAYSENGIACYHWPFMLKSGEYLSDMDNFVGEIEDVTTIDVFSNRQPFDDCKDTLKDIKSHYKAPVRFHQPVEPNDKDPMVQLGANSSTSNYGALKTTNV